MAREVGRQHVGTVGHQRGPELLEHVGGLATAVQARRAGQAPVAPLQVVHLATVDHHEAAAATLGDVVSGDGAHVASGVGVGGLGRAAG